MKMMKTRYCRLMIRLLISSSTAFAGNNLAVVQTFTTEKPSEMSYVSLTNVMITNSNADSLGVAINNLDWSNKSIFIANNNESKSFTLGQKMASGMYYAHLNIDNESVSRKIVITK